jgi:predicted MarR family transcription regulator
MTTVTLSPVAGSAEEKAWIDVQAWYNKCITAAPKPDASRPHVNIGHIIRWCQDWDINTDDIEAICQKHDAYKEIRPFVNPFPR